MPVTTYSQPGNQGYTPSQIYGTIPQVPLPTTTAPAAIAGNLGTLGSLYGLSQGTGAASGAGALSNLEQGLPGAAGLLSQASGDVSSELSGSLPADVMAQIAQAGAESGVETGSPGSPASEAAMLKALGLTSLSLEEQGQTDLGKLIGETPTGPQYNPATMQTTPEAQQSAAAANAIYSSAPLPAAAAGANMGAAGAGLGAGLGAGRAPSGAPLPTLGTGTTPGPSDYGTVGAPSGTATGALGGLYGLQPASPSGAGAQEVTDASGDVWAKTATGWINQLTGETSETAPDTGEDSTVTAGGVTGVDSSDLDFGD